nr:hypothetical protein [Tanacetum cinerariifolium]
MFLIIACRAENRDSSAPPLGCEADFRRRRGDSVVVHMEFLKSFDFSSPPPPDEGDALDFIVSQSFLWISSRNLKFKFSWAGWLQNHLASMASFDIPRVLDLSLGQQHFFVLIPTGKISSSWHVIIIVLVQIDNGLFSPFLFTPSITEIFALWITKCDATKRAYEAKRDKELAMMQCRELEFLMLDPLTLPPEKRAIIKKKQ